MGEGAPSSATTLARARPVLDVYYRALSGRRAHLLEHDDAAAQAPDTTTTVRLPGRIDDFGSPRGNFDWYKVALTHRAAHYELGSFDYRLDRPSRVSPRLALGAASLPRLDPETDLERVLRAFTYRSLAIDVFTVAEDLRVDALLPSSYPGTARALAAVQAAELDRRPDPSTLPPRTALLEVFVRLSLGAQELPLLPRLLHEPAVLLRAAAKQLRTPSATVEDAVEVAVRAYALITRLPNLPADYGDATPVPVGTARAHVDAWSISLPEPDPVRLEGDAILETGVAPVDYRDLLGWRYGRYGVPGPPGQEAIFRLRALPGADDGATAADSRGEGDEPRPEGPPEPLPHEHHEWFVDRYRQAEGALDVEGPEDHLYPEWDHVQGRYRERWCRVRERLLVPESGTRLHDETLRAYADVLPDVVRQLERFAPEGLRVVGRQPDGDDLDLDASIEALVDLRVGLSASEAIHQRLERVARDVAVAFLLDLSSSTAERLEAPPAETRRFQRIHGRPYRRIIDVEQESVSLLLAALQRTGDAVGVYGFSGTGRGDVRFDVVKALDERMSRRVAGRIGQLRPVHTTRMGPAIRHTTAKLRGWHAATKLLVLVSDGRPFDHDYGQSYGDGAELDYAVQDTRRALAEAGDHGVRPFLLTVDTDGQDYLQALAGDVEYEVLSDVGRLPLHLLNLYRRLTS
ncbi:MAG: nitric oxide reductase activation protein NorD [Egibacteraceae bacterium]